jgi:hypothetical protein
MCLTSAAAISHRWAGYVSDRSHGRADPGRESSTGITTGTHGRASTLGIASVKTQLPVGIAPAMVTLAGAPKGWALTPTSDGFELGGPALAPGQSAGNRSPVLG